MPERGMNLLTIDKRNQLHVLLKFYHGHGMSFDFDHLRLRPKLSWKEKLKEGGREKNLRDDQVKEINNGED